MNLNPPLRARLMHQATQAGSAEGPEGPGGPGLARGDTLYGQALPQVPAARAPGKPAPPSASEPSAGKCIANAFCLWFLFLSPPSASHSYC